MWFLRFYLSWVGWCPTDHDAGLDVSTAALKSKDAVKEQANNTGVPYACAYVHLPLIYEPLFISQISFNTLGL